MTMLRLRHLGRLTGAFVGNARVNRSWWVVLLVATLATLAAIISLGQATVPHTIYTLF